MNGKEKRRIAVQDLVLSGYTLEKIAEKLNISISTVSRTISKSRKESKQWLINLAQKDMASIYRESLDGLKQDLMHLNELLENESVQNNIKLQLQIRREITHVRAKYLEYLLQGPMVWSMDVLAKTYHIEPIEQPVMESLGGISGVK